MVKTEIMALAKDSYERCCDDPTFFESFYRNFFQRCPEVEPLFEQTDFERQYRLLQHAIGMLLIFPSQPQVEPSILDRIADRHSRKDLDIDPSHYPGWVDSLVATVRQYDKRCTPEIEAAWRQTVAPGVAYMISRY